MDGPVRRGPSIVKDLYNRSWEKNWGFVPMTSERSTPGEEAQAHPLSALGAVRGAGREARGFHLALPDYNLVLKELHGSLLPFGCEVPAAEKKIDRVRTSRSASSRIPARPARRAPYYEAVKEASAEVPRGELVAPRGQPRHPAPARGLRRRIYCRYGSSSGDSPDSTRLGGRGARRLVAAGLVVFRSSSRPWADDPTGRLDGCGGRRTGAARAS